MVKSIEYFYIITIKVKGETTSFSGVAVLTGNNFTEYNVYNTLMTLKVLPYIRNKDYSVVFYYAKDNN